jgi:phosphatidylethanolamine/phosphatidyl-N-methylethanolamine N-methyltransferase
METFEGRTAKGLFFRRFLAHPGRVASLFPSSQALSRMIAGQVRRADDEYVIELGAGTGTVTHAILSSGVPADKLIVVEIDRVMAQFLRTAYPTITVLECSAFDIMQSLPQPTIGKVGCVVCGLPITLYQLEWQRRLAVIILSLMPRGRPFLVLTHRLASPILAKKMGLVGKRVGFTLRNFPPASVWAYARDTEASTCGVAR